MRRIVTTVDRDGNPDVLFDDSPPTVDFGRTSANEIWLTSSTPPETHATGDPAAGDWTLEPPARGSIFRLATHQPGETVPIHSTRTVDYVVVLTGELVLLLGDREIVLTAGDTVVQRETPHGWANRSDEPCSVAAVLLSTLP